MINYAIFGATSAIATQTARALVSPNANFFLVGRKDQDLEKIAADLRVRGARIVDTKAYNFLEAEGLENLTNQIVETMGSIDQALIAFGTLNDQNMMENYPLEAAKDITLNFTHAAILSQYLANSMKKKGSGLLAVITSVAGDRGRGSNYIYGAAKGGLGLFLQGMRHKLSNSGVEILDIRPGFVDTPMTANFPKGPLWADAESVGKYIAGAMQQRKGGRLYVPSFWAFIMLIIRNIPTFIFHKTKL